METVHIYCKHCTTQGKLLISFCFKDTTMLTVRGFNSQLIDPSQRLITLSNLHRQRLWPSDMITTLIAESIMQKCLYTSDFQINFIIR